MADPGGDGSGLFHGLPSRTLTLPNGDHLRVLLHGAQVVSWVAGGRERLYLSPLSRFDGVSAIRGGIPVCFPQFNQRGSLPKHGFVRNLSWQADDMVTRGAAQAELTLRLSSGAATLSFWPQAFEAQLTLLLQPGSLKLTLLVRNTDRVALDFTGALHTYLAIADIAAVQLEGLAGRPEWDALTNLRAQAQDPLRFGGEFDRVYDTAAPTLLLHDGQGRLGIEQSPTWAQTVVWNPGAEKAAVLADLPAEGYKHMLCVEAAQVVQPITVAAGAQWQGWQRLTLR